MKIACRAFVALSLSLYMLSPVLPTGIATGQASIIMMSEDDFLRYCHWCGGHQLEVKNLRAYFTKV